MLSREIKIGSLKLGGVNPVRIQGMLKSPIDDYRALFEEGRQMIDAGAELIRCAVPTEEAAEKLYGKLRELSVPLIADCHFKGKIAEKALMAGFDKIRINPGNIKENSILEAVELAGKEGKALRLGFNTGSCKAENAIDLARLGLRWDKKIRDTGFKNFAVSMKSSSVKKTVEANRYFSMHSDSPLHIGITATGPRDEGIVKSSAGLGTLLLDEIGDTVRVSLTGSSIKEIELAVSLRDIASDRITKPTIISCPTCSRCRADIEEMVEKVSQKIKEIDFNKPVKIAIMGCEVNGPGEAKSADIGICGTEKGGLIIKKGKIMGNVNSEEMLSRLIEELKKL
ncbi:MAG: flavodoxin/ferredoxin-dependent (E)-4-hydroxy-3-methylbut-2-enyl-diphosphate synthase [Elusimicrobiota bacterium]|nr:flavodoxin/ferredoxin-dependent (E)-4-hydroxy-3-methylbut-2-enyl-diphosphate synthase [Elusimicrobiota bacterium]